jgi:hypothetical protein
MNKSVILIQIQQHARYEDDLESNRAMRDQGGGSPQLEQDINRLEKMVEILSQEKLCYEAQILRVCLQIQILLLHVYHSFCSKCLNLRPEFVGVAACFWSFPAILEWMLIT